MPQKINSTMRSQSSIILPYVTMIFTFAILIPHTESWGNPIDYPSNSPRNYNPWTNIPLPERSRQILQQIQGVIRNFWQFPSSANRNFQSFSNIPVQSNWNQQQLNRDLYNPTFSRHLSTRQQPRQQRQRTLYACDKFYEPTHEFVTPEIRRKFQNCCYSFPRSTFACNNGTSICWGEWDKNLPKCCAGGCGESPSPENIFYHLHDLKIVQRDESECDGLASETDEERDNLRKCCDSFPRVIFHCGPYQSEHCNVGEGPCCGSCGQAHVGPIQRSTPRSINLDLDYYD